MKLLMWPGARKQTTPELLPKFAKVIEVDLEGVGAISAQGLHSHLALRLAQEGFRRAAEEDSEGIARNGPVYSQCESLAQKAVRACRGENIEDPELVRILAFNGVLEKSEPNQAAQTTPGLRPSVSDL